jgi:non-ribosomal peptide synthetase component F
MTAARPAAPPKHAQTAPHPDAADTPPHPDAARAAAAAPSSDSALAEIALADSVLPEHTLADLALADPALADDEAAYERPLFDVFAAIAARQPDHLAVDDGTTHLSYAELRDRALQLGARIAALVPADGLVGVAVPTNALHPVAWLACFAARRPFLQLDPHLPAARNQAIVAEAGLAAAIVPTTADLAAWLPAGLPRIPMAAEPGPEPAPLPAGLPPSRVGMVVFTSGSTGRAKGIALHERSTQRKAMNYRAIDLGPDDRLLSLHPPTTSAGARDTIGALLCGASLHLVDLKRDGLTRALTVLRGSSITVCATVPAVARALMAMDGTADAFRGLRIMRLGGDVIMDTDIAALARLLAPTARILVSFGMTEAGGALIQRLIDPGAPVETGRIAMGTPVAGQTVSVEDANGDPVRPGETGELVIRGRYIALGHWVAGRLDASAFAADPSAPGRSCFRSADVMLLRPDGMLVPLGRADRQVKINGMRVEPGDTEAALRGLPGVADAAVLVHGHADAPMLVAFVVPAPAERTAEPSAQNAAHRQNAAHLARGWRAALAALLPPQQVPSRIRVVPAIPLLPSLKPDLAALRALLPVGDAGGVFARVRARLRGAG